jgi:catechol 2,3-dioxygenase-like lactoylglutathione lyase family enzyme
LLGNQDLQKQREKQMPLRSLHHVAFTVTDLDKTQQFTEDFGLLTVDKSSDALVMKTGGGDAWCYRAELGDERGFVGFGFVVDDESDLAHAVEHHGATEIRELDTPGGGRAVTLTSPDGMKIDLVHGIQGEAPQEVQPELRLNTPALRGRHGESQTHRPLGPAALYRLGHLGLFVNDYRASAEWFKETLGITCTDAMHVPGVPQHTLVGFLRIDRGPEWVDHHTIFLGEDTRTDLHHVSFEVQDYEAQFMAHRWLESKGWEPNWGVGRHPLGCHVFDVWFDPDRYRFETFSDTDLVNEDHETGHYDISTQDLDMWSSEPPNKYFE